jgi:type IV secretion system protein VirB10
MNPNSSDEIVGERGAIGAESPKKGKGMAGKGAVVAVMLAGCSYLAWSAVSPSGQPEEEAPKKFVIKQTSDFEPAPPPKVEPVALVPEVALPTPGATPVKKVEDDPLLQSAQRAPVIAFSKESSRRGEAGGGGERASPFVPVNEEPDRDAQKFQNLMKPTVLQGARARRLGNRNFIVAMGTSIPCVLEAALASDQPGFTSCVINRDILSDNGRVVLMEKGTQVVGEYRGGLQRGQKRLFVLWTRAKTPEGVIVQLASPATDAIGRAGFDGYVDTHFWERFGAALLLSVVGDISAWATDQLADSDVSAESTSNAGKDAAAIAVEQSINIPPTLRKHQGSLINIFVARDLDFSGVYGLRVTEGRTRIFDRGVSGDFSPDSGLVTK